MKSIGYFGKEIGITLNSLLFAVIEGKIPNEFNALMEYSQKIKN